MAVVNKAYKFRIYPSESQKILIEKTFGCTRLIWNTLLDYNKKGYSSEGKNWKLDFSYAKIRNMNEYSFLKEVPSVALQNKSIDLKRTYEQFFKSVNGERKTKLSGVNFKKKGKSRDSFRVSNNPCCWKLDQDNKKIWLSKLSWIDYKDPRIILDNAKILSFTVSKIANQYFCSIAVEEDIPLKPITSLSVGVDLGIKDLFITSDGAKIQNPKWFRKSQAKLSRLQKLGKNKKSGSNRQKKHSIKIKRLHLHVSNQRNDFIQKFSTELVNTYDLICVEDLNIKGMLKNHCLSKSIADASWGKFVSTLLYKCNWYGKTLVKIDRFYPSSKTCSCCGYKLDELDLSVREWNCPVCGANHDRDVNAAKNILKQGVKILSGELLDYEHGGHDL